MSIFLPIIAQHFLLEAPPPTHTPRCAMSLSALCSTFTLNMFLCVWLVSGSQAKLFKLSECVGWCKWSLASVERCSVCTGVCVQKRDAVCLCVSVSHHVYLGVSCVLPPILFPVGLFSCSSSSSETRFDYHWETHTCLRTSDYSIPLRSRHSEHSAFIWCCSKLNNIIYSLFLHDSRLTGSYISVSNIG